MGDKKIVGTIVLIFGILLALAGLIGLVFTGLIFIAFQNWSALAELAGAFIAGIIMTVAGFYLMRD